MNLLNINEQEKFFTKALLFDVYNWKNKKREEILQKNPNISNQDLNGKIQNSFSKKFRDQFNNILKFRIYNLSKKN